MTPFTDHATREKLVDALSQAMPDPVRMAHAKAVAVGNITEAKRIIIRFVLQQLNKGA